MRFKNKLYYFFFVFYNIYLFFLNFSVDGIELGFATNVIGYFLLHNLLLIHLKNLEMEELLILLLLMLEVLI